MGDTRLVAIAGGSGFIGRAIARQLDAVAGLRVRVLSRNPDKARRLLPGLDADFVSGDVTEPTTVPAAIAGAQIVINAVQFDGYPVENPARGLTFERVDYQGTLALLENAKAAGADHFIYISGAAADEHSSHPGFRAKGRAERAIIDSGLAYTIFRPSLVFGPEDRTVNLFVKGLRLSPVFAAPGSGQQKLQPVLVDDLAACVAAAVDKAAARNRVFEVGGPELMTFDRLIELLMQITGYRRRLIHIPEGMLRAIGTVAARLPRPILSADAVTFVTADNVCDTQPLIDALGVKFTPLREAMAYLASNQAR